MNVELERYLARPECDALTDEERTDLRTYVEHGPNQDYPVGRRLSYGLMRINSNHEQNVVNQNFINWLYTY